MKIVHDATVIRAYMRRQPIIEDETMCVDMLALMGNTDHDACAKKQCVPFLFPSSPYISLINAVHTCLHYFLTLQTEPTDLFLS